MGPGKLSAMPKVDALRARLERFEESAAGRFWQEGDRRADGIGHQSHTSGRLADRDGNQTVATLTWVSAIILVLGAIGMASTLQTWYHRIYEQTPPKGLPRHVAYQLAGVAAFAVHISFEVWLFNKVRPVGGRGLIFLLTFVLAVLFWWVAAYMLLYRQVPLRKMLPAGVATGTCITGLGVVSSLVFSGQITSGERSYGPAGVVLALISFLVGFGVCLHLGAVFGRMWNERQAERAAIDERGGREG